MSQDNKLHEYDGIVEENNPLPKWWVWKFILTVVFAAIYYFHYELAGGPTLIDELKVAMKEITAMQASAPSSAKTVSEEELMKNAQDPQKLQAGAAVYVGKCAVCHGENLEGKIGPNLTDKHWINGDGKLATIVGLVKTGVPAKGMPPWDGVLKEDEILNVAAFVHSKKGSNPANAKAPEGNEVAE